MGKPQATAHDLLHFTLTGTLVSMQQQYIAKQCVSVTRNQLIGTVTEQIN